MRSGRRLRTLALAALTVALLGGFGEQVTRGDAAWAGRGGYDSRYVHPGGGYLDAFMLSRQEGPFAVGFDVADSPLGGLPIDDTVYAHGYELFTMATFCDGWIYTQPIAQYEGVTYIDGWINPGNIERARAGEGPSFIEGITYRLGVHTTADDPTRYREDEEAETWLGREPLIRFRKYLEDSGHLDEETRLAIEEHVKGTIDAAVHASM